MPEAGLLVLTPRGGEVPPVPASLRVLGFFWAMPILRLTAKVTAALEN